MSERTPIPRGRVALALSVAFALSLVMGLVPALASHAVATLPGSNFEIDVNANLKVDDPAPSIDWASVTEQRKQDLASGQNDDSYAGGSKEDDACPGTTTGSIPNNKSDLLTFGAYVEPEVGGPGFLNLFWTRVQEPSGTTLMDFELNQSSTDCGNGVNPLRTVGDLLIEYRIEQGGAIATLRLRTWTGSEWGPAVALSPASQAAGTINLTPIPAGESDGLISTGSISPRTFGEAQLDLDFIFDEGECDSFGSAFLKSRSSDSFTSQMKDFIKPVPVNITNCGKVIIRKQTNPDEDPNVTSFGYTKSFSTDPSTSNTFSLMDDGVQTFNNVLFGTGYTVTEDVIPAGWDFASLDCSASTGVTPSINDRTVTFAIDNAADVLDCTYTNRARGQINILKTDDTDAPMAGVRFDLFTDNAPLNGPAPHGVEDVAVAPAKFCITDANGECSITNIVPGQYWVVEDTTTLPAGFDPAPDQNVVVDAGETVSLTFVNPRQRGQINILKTDDTDAPMAGVRFDLFTDNAPLNGPAPHGVEDVAVAPAKFCITDANGECSITDIVPGQYWVVEDTTTLPAGFDPAPDQNVVVGASATVSLTFVDPRQAGAIQVTKTRKHAADGSGDHPHAGVDFTITGGSLPAGGTTITTNAQGEACLDGLVLSSHVGNYTVHEVTPAGYAGEADETVTVDNKATCEEDPYVGETVSFENTPLTDITVTVNSQIDGGTGSTIDCDAAADPPFDKTVPAAAPDNGDGSFTLSNQEPGTYTCVIVVDP